MREALFIKKNAQKWNEYQYLQTEDPDQMADRFITLLDDLSYAKTFYPHSKVTRWINSLAVSIYQTIYQNRKQRFSRLITFWQYELPLMFRKHHRMLFYTFIFFLLLFAMGVLSSIKDDQFVRGVLGEDYVAMTEENIEKGDPFGVYASESRFAMWVQIAFNNIKVGFLMVASGILNETHLVKVPGNKMLLAITNPAQASMIIPAISNVPCIHITNTLCQPRPFAKNMY